MRNEGKAAAFCASRMQIIALIAGCVAIIMVITASVAYSMSKQVEIVDNGVTTKIVTFATTVSEVLAANKLNIEEKDEVIPVENQQLCDGMQIIITRAKNIVVEYDGKTIDIITGKPTINEMMQQEGFILEGEDTVEPGIDQPIVEGMNVKFTKIRFETITQQNEIPFRQIRRLNYNLAPNETKTAKTGVKGLKEDAYQVKYVNGQEVERELTSSKVLKNAVNEVIEYSGSVGVTSRGGMRYKNVITVSATAYHAGFNSRNGQPARTAAGMSLKRGIVAVDPRVIPLGTRLYIEDPSGRWTYGYAVAGDTGGAIKGNRIDICLDTYAEAVQFGRRTLNVYILE